MKKIPVSYLIPLILALLVGTAHLRGLNVPFHFDDSHSVETNVSIRSLSFIPQLLTDPSTSSMIPENRHYRPLTFVTFALSWWLGGGATWAFHLFKMAMHFGVTWFLFLIWRNLLSRKGWLPFEQFSPQTVAFALAALFAIHPACVETVTYISATSSLQCSLFYTAAFYAFLKFWDTGSRRMQLLSLLLYAGSVFSKEEGVTLPAVLAVTALILSEGPFLARVKIAIRKTWPHWLLMPALGYTVVSMMPATNSKSRGDVPPMEYFMTQWRAYLWYMRLWFWPWDLNADNLAFDFSHSIRDQRVIQALIGNIALIALAWWNRVRFPAFLFGLLWFYITISPASSVVPLAEPVNEHRMYLSYVGFVGGSLLVVGWLFFGAIRPALSLRATQAVSALIVAGLFIGTQNRITVWQTHKNLWEDTVEKNPTSGRALNNLALIYMGTQEYPKALDLLNRCQQAWPYYVYCALNKGLTYYQLKDSVNAEQNLIRAYQLDADNMYVNLFLGRLYEDLKPDPQRAVMYLMRADALSSGRNVEAKHRMMYQLYKLGNVDKAREVAHQVLSLDPANYGAKALLSEIQNRANASVPAQN